MFVRKALNNFAAQTKIGKVAQTSVRRTAPRRSIDCTERAREGMLLNWISEYRRRQVSARSVRAATI